MEYKAVIGLEVHAELLTNTKIFCGCTTAFGGEPNTHTCPVCLGLPGTLPVLNKKVVEYAIKAGLATNCKISEFSKMDRKNYFYPDLPKAYQISQYDLPLCHDGYIEIEVEGKTKRIGIRRIHIEEDAGKLMHTRDGSLVDYNRAGVPLIEIVSEPDINSPEEAYAYLTKLKSILQYIEVSDCKMEEGSLRCDTNVSLMRVDAKEFGTKIELKNLNSFKAVQKSLEYEIKRQRDILESGDKVIQETRRWDESRGITLSMRTKEEAHDYRYFPEPDLVPIVVDKEWVERIRAELPELPDQKRERFVRDYGIPEYDAEVLTGTRALANFFEETVKLYNNPKAVSNWIMSEVLRILNDKAIEIQELNLKPQQLAQLLDLIEKGTISGSIAKKVFEDVIETGEDPENIVKEKGLVQLSDEGQIREIVKQVLKENQKSVNDYKSGKEKAFGFLVGQIMRVTKGKANPQIANKILKEELDNLD